MKNWQRWLIGISLPFAVGFLQSFEEGTSLLDAARHGAHALVPTLLALKMTLQSKEN